MLRRNLRAAYRGSRPTPEQKEAMLEAILTNKPDASKVKGRKWKARGQLGSWLLILALVLAILAGAWLLADHLGLTDYVLAQWQQHQQQEPSQEGPADTEPDASQETELPQDPYAGIPQTYLTAIQEKWDVSRCDQEGISLLVASVRDPSKLQYTLVDLDGDGSQELIITDGNVVYDLYALQNGEVTRLITGWERNAYTLTKDNVIINRGSNGAASTIYTFYRFFAGNLIVDQQVIYDAGRDPENPWFRGFGDPESAEPITEEQANQIIDSMINVPIFGQPLEEYPDQ